MNKNIVDYDYDYDNYDSLKIVITMILFNLYDV